MATAIGSVRRIPVSAIIIAVISAVALAIGIYYLSSPVKPVSNSNAATAEAKAYLPNLELSDVTMQATENFMQQQVVEVQGKIANHGPRKLALIEVYCLFSGADGREIHRERITIAKGLGPQEARTFRLPFDTIPDGWNQAMPRLVIARIAFSN